jgi:exosortase D (VPLPA-CTERM-specific)
MRPPSTPMDVLHTARVPARRLGAWSGSVVLLIAYSAWLVMLYWDTVRSMVSVWYRSETFAHGFVILPISLWLVWRDRAALAQMQPRRELAPWALAAMAGAVAVWFAGELADVLPARQFAWITLLLAGTWLIVGTDVMRRIAFPALFLYFAVPAGEFLLPTLIEWTADFTVAALRASGVPVLRDGMTFQIPTGSWSVVEACSGLRYLFSLVTLGVIAAYFFRAPLWQKLVLVLSTLPITVFMNSLRIAIVGVTVEHFGRSAAEGVLHDFEGIVVFLGCTLILIAEMWLLSRLSGRKLQDAFVMSPPARREKSVQVRTRAIPGTLGVALALLAGAAVAAQIMPKGQHTAPARKDFSYFPQQVGDWRGRPYPMEQQYLDVLKLDDYMLANYADSTGRLVNLYVAYYAAQTNRLHDHSPRQCMPGGGWEIRKLENYTVPGVSLASVPLQVNRVLIEKGGERQLAYYFFRQRDRTLTSESMVKFYMVYDMITRQRSDGALVRLVTALAPGERLSAGDERLAAFAAELAPRLTDYVPR